MSGRKQSKQNKPSTARARKRPPTQDDLYKVKYVGDGVLSPDGKIAAYVLSETTGQGDKENQSLSVWIVSTEGGEPRRLTRGKANSYHPRFSADGKSLYFLSSRDKVTQIYSMPTDGGEAEPITHLPQGAGPFEVSPDGKSLAFAALSGVPPKPTNDDHIRIDRAWYRFDPVPGYLQNISQAVYVLQLGGGKPIAVTKAEGLVLALAYSPDSRQIALTRTAAVQKEFMQTDLCVVSLGRKPSERVIIENSSFYAITWTEDGTDIIYEAASNGLASQNAMFIADARTGKTVNRTGQVDINIGTIIQEHIPVRLSGRILTDESAAYTTTSIGGEANLAVVKLSGKKEVRSLTAGSRLCHLLAKHERKFLFISQSINSPPELHMIDISTGDERTLTRHNKEWKSTHQLPQWERLLVRSEKNVEVEGWVLKPALKRAPYKTILVIHGGPHSGYGYGFGLDLQELVGAGYAIAYMNPRGSTGYGDEFCRSILGCWGDLELKDFNAFLDELIKRKIAHPDKLGVTGISGGGHLCSWLISHTNRFKAAVPEQGVYNMLSMWGTSDVGKVLMELEMGGPPHKMPMTYWERSPIAHAHKCTTPTLLLQGEQDVRCPMEQAEQLYTALEHHGCEVELIRMNNCNHAAQIRGRPSLRRFRVNVLREWFDRHIK
ncbi:MAG: S9 family peptidase [Gammaproteobacteria bacterium]|nr:S9 family peptidase [Gammaproteobacteria bacterium]